jgi:transcriptional antiterminator
MLQSKLAMMSAARERLAQAIQVFEQQGTTFTLGKLVKTAHSSQTAALRNSELWKSHCLFKKTPKKKSCSVQSRHISRALKVLLSRGEYITLASLKRETGYDPSVLLKHDELWKPYYTQPNTVSHSPLRSGARKRIEESKIQLEQKNQPITLSALHALSGVSPKAIRRHKDLWDLDQHI